MAGIVPFLKKVTENKWASLVKEGVRRLTGNDSNVKVHRVKDQISSGDVTVRIC